MKKRNKAIALAMALTLSGAMMTSLTGCGGSSTAPKGLTFDTADGTFAFDAVKDADTYTVGVCKVLNDTTGEALLSINGATLAEIADGKSYYLWSEQSGSASGVADTDSDGKVDGLITFREYSSSATTVGAVMKMEDLAPGHYVLQAMANSNTELTDPQTAYYEFIIGGTLAEPTGFTAEINEAGCMEVTAPSSYYLKCLTATGMPTKMKFEVKEGGNVVDTFELEDFSYTNSVNGPNKSFSFNHNTYAGTAKLDSAKDYTVTVTAVGDGDTIQDASAEAYMATKTAEQSFATMFDTKGSATTGDMTVAVTLGKNANGEDIYELTGTINSVVVLRESGTYEASAQAAMEDEVNTYPDGTTITFTTAETDADAAVLDGVTAKVEKSEGGMGGFPGGPMGPGGGSSTPNYNLIAEGLSLNGETFDLTASSGMGGFPGGPMGPG